MFSIKLGTAVVAGALIVTVSGFATVSQALPSPEPAGVLAPSMSTEYTRFGGGRGGGFRGGGGGFRGGGFHGGGRLAAHRGSVGGYFAGIAAGIAAWRIDEATATAPDMAMATGAAGAPSPPALPSEPQHRIRITVALTTTATTPAAMDMVALIGERMGTAVAIMGVGA